MSPQKIFAPAALTALMGLASGVQAQSLNMYGVIDITAGSFQASYQDGTANPRATKVDGNQMITSFFGLRGTEDLGGGLKAGFMLESFLRPDVGGSGRTGSDVFWARAANVWLENSLGKLVVGRQGTLLFTNALTYNPLGSAFGLSPTIRLTFLGAPNPTAARLAGNDKSDSGFSNAISYFTPNLSGFTGAVQVQFGESAAEDTTYALSAQYRSGPFSIGGAWQSVESAEAPKPDFLAGQKQNFGMLGVSYDAGFARFFGQYGEFRNYGFTVDADQIDTKLFTLGASVPVTKTGTVIAAYGMSSEEANGTGTTPDTDHTVFTLAYTHSLSKRTTAYAAYMMDKEDRDTGPKFKTGHTYLVGVRHAF